MDYEILKNEFIKLKREELDYIDNIATISSNKILSEYEKLEIYRTLKKYEVKLNIILRTFRNEIIAKVRKEKQLIKENLKDIIIEIYLGEKYLSSVKFSNERYKKHVLEDLGIDMVDFKYKLTLSEVIYNHGKYKVINPDIIQNDQRLIESPIYIFCGYYDYSEDCYGPCLKGVDDYLYGIYENISKCSDKEEIPKKRRSEFEKDKTIIYSKKYVHSHEIRKIFEEELLNIQNETLSDCINQTKNRIEELNYTRSPEYKEKVLLDRINELYKNVKGELIQKEILYNGKFLGILREIYKLPNGNVVKKEKIIKNGGKNSVIVIAITQDKEYIITFQNRIKDNLIAEFPSGYIENFENPIEAAKRELEEETGYITDDLFIVDEAYTSLGIDNSITYIVVANNCIKTNKKSVSGTELVNYGLFFEEELKYLIDKNIMKGAMNKLAYYNLINNVDDCNVIYAKSNKKIYKILKNKTSLLKK